MRWAALIPYSSRRTVTYRFPPIGIGARENRRSTTPLRNRDPRVPIIIHGYRSGTTGDPHRRCRTGAGCRRMPVVRGARCADGAFCAWASPGHGPSSANPRPNMACSRRRHRRFANVYSFVWPWRFMNAHSAARLRHGVGRHVNATTISRLLNRIACYQVG